MTYEKHQRELSDWNKRIPDKALSLYKEMKSIISKGNIVKETD